MEEAARARRATRDDGPAEDEDSDMESDAEGRNREEAGAEKAADQEARAFRQTWKKAPDKAPNPDGFVPQKQRLPRDHDLATAHAKEALLDSVRQLLDLHYEVQLRETARKEARAKEKKKELGGEAATPADPTADQEKRFARRRVYGRAAEAIAENRYESFMLPKEVKHLLNGPADERTWKNAETLRAIVRRRAELLETVNLMTPEEVEQLADGLAAGKSPTGDVVGGRRDFSVGGVRLRAGYRVEVPPETTTVPSLKPKATAGRQQKKPALETVEAQVRRIVPGPDAKVVVRRRPRGAEDAKAVAIDEFADLIWDARPVRVAAKDWCGVRNPDETLHVDEVVDALLTQLGLLLFHEQVERWNEAKVAWTSPAKTTEAIRWYIQGQRVGDRPIFDSMCARCGGWLYGHMNQSLGGGNKVNGEPRDVNDKPWPGTSQSQAESQPPFLLRHSPTFIAKMAPDVFEWDETTNRLTLTERHRGAPPWRIRKGTKASDAEKNSWLYCRPCHGTLFDPEPTPSVPFRDRASGARMRPDPKWGGRTPGEESAAEPGAAGTAAANTATETARTGIENRTAAEEVWTKYRENWERKLVHHARSPGGDFGHENLVPEPQSEFWQDAPHSPLGELKSPEAQGRLAVCQLFSNMEKSGVHAGVATYAQTTGETTLRRQVPR